MEFGRSPAVSYCYPSVISESPFDRANPCQFILRDSPSPQYSRTAPNWLINPPPSHPKGGTRMETRRLWLKGVAGRWSQADTWGRGEETEAGLTGNDTRDMNRNSGGGSSARPGLNFAGLGRSPANSGLRARWRDQRQFRYCSIHCSSLGLQRRSPPTRPPRLLRLVGILMPSRKAVASQPHQRVHPKPWN